jgi:NAD(P)-dependent dehydrogenase (short-subunit alcohol dehydrogenase family)
VRHEGKVAVVTGGAKGIGRACVERLLEDGASVVIADLDESAAAQVVAASNGRAVMVRADVTDEMQVEAAYDEAVGRFGRLDISINNAGVIFVSPFLEATSDQWRRLLDVNVMGVVHGARSAAKRMIASGEGGVIINASSGGGRHGVPNFAHYCASKAAITMLSQSLAIELASYRVRVNCYAPGHIETPLWNGIADGFAEVAGLSREETLRTFLDTIPWGRFGTPRDVANAVSWLCTEDAEYISGQCIAMNGAELPWT